jgi:hypothetical protein
MRDGSRKLRLRGSLWINMDELVIIGCGRESIDAGLINLEPA